MRRIERICADFWFKSVFIGVYPCPSFMHVTRLALPVTLTSCVHRLVSTWNNSRNNSFLNS
jgi:hypothetical protein